MGWDMYAVGPRGGRKPARAAFRAAASEVVRKAGSVDCGLGDGWLDCSPCARWMEAFHGRTSAWKDWTPEDFRAANANANAANTEAPEGESWDYWSAREFIRVCAENNLWGRASF